MTLITETPVWDAMDGDAQLKELNRQWEIAWLNAHVSLSRHSTFSKLLDANRRESAAIDLIIPPKA